MADPDAHLLIVDDDERIRGLLQKFLIRHGFLVSAARDAAHARRIFDTRNVFHRTGIPVDGARLIKI